MWVLHKERGFYIQVLSRLQERITHAQGGGEEEYVASDLPVISPLYWLPPRWMVALQSGSGAPLSFYRLLYIKRLQIME